MVKAGFDVWLDQSPLHSEETLEHYTFSFQNFCDLWCFSPHNPEFTGTVLFDASSQFFAFFRHHECLQYTQIPFFFFFFCLTVLQAFEDVSL
jgi:hypothetical protein